MRLFGFEFGKPKPSVDPVFDAIANRHVCPDCGSDKFHMGPQGGMCQNIKCANKACGSEFNVAPFEDGQFLDVPFLVERIRSYKDNETREKVTAP